MKRKEGRRLGTEIKLQSERRESALVDNFSKQNYIAIVDGERLVVADRMNVSTMLIMYAYDLLIHSVMNYYPCIA